jgi:hypothetical protein
LGGRCIKLRVGVLQRVPATHKAFRTPKSVIMIEWGSVKEGVAKVSLSHSKLATWQQGRLAT